MSFYPIPKKAYVDDRPTDSRPKRAKYMKKIKIPTQMKTKKCTFCGNPGTTIQVSEKEKRTLCRDHLNDHKRKDLKYSVKFERASS